MSLELWNTFATFGTFIVIAATAIAALVQLRHASGGNQIAAIAEISNEYQMPQFEAAVRFVRIELPDKLKDPEFRYQLSHPAARTSENRALMQDHGALGNFYERIGLLVKNGALDSRLAMDLLSHATVADWQRLWPSTAILRREQGDSLLENFEYLAVLAQDWNAAHPTSYPSGVRRFGLKDEWLEADRQYEASRVPA